MVKLNLIYNYKNLTDKRTPKYIEWQNPFDDSVPNILVDKYCFNSVPNKDRDCALMIEPRSYIPEVYSYIDKNANKFKYVFTTDEKHLKTLPNAKKIIWGGMWIKELDQDTYKKKSKLVSMLASDKQVIYMHKQRYKIAHSLKDKIDCYGSFNGNHAEKETALRDYMFSITVECALDKNWFSEKIIDCFATMTIPIWYGCDNIGEYFNIDGIIMFNNKSNLDQIISKCTEEYYNANIEAIIDNYNRALKYQCFEDTLYEMYSKELEQL